MSNGREALPDQPAPASPLAKNPAILFAPTGMENKEALRDKLTPQLRGYIGEVIRSFLEFNEKLGFLGLSSTINKLLKADPVFKHTLFKELLFTLIGAYQGDSQKYKTHHAILLQANTLKLVKGDIVKTYLTYSVCIPNNQYNENQNQALIIGFQDPHKQALAKSLLLELIRAHQYNKAAIFLKRSPEFLNKIGDRLDYLFALMVSGYQTEAEAYIKEYPDLLKQSGKVIFQGQVYPDLTPYQYTLCMQHTQMQIMIRRWLSNNDAALQAKEFEEKPSLGMARLREKHQDLMDRTEQAYEFYLDKYSSWSFLQSRDYWNRVIGGLQAEWPVSWMQEFFYPVRTFNQETDFSSEEALRELPTAKHPMGKNFYPWDRGYYETRIMMRGFPSDVDLNEELLLKERIAIEGEDATRMASLLLIKQGEDYFVYGPQLSGNIDQAVEWKLAKLDISTSILINALNKIDFRFVESVGMTLTYRVEYNPIYAAIDKALNCRVAGFGFSFNSAISKEDSSIQLTWGRELRNISENLLGLRRLYAARKEELENELKTVKHSLPKNEETSTFIEPASTHSQSCKI